MWRGGRVLGRVNQQNVVTIQGKTALQELHPLDLALILRQQAKDSMGHDAIEVGPQAAVHPPGQALVVDHGLAVMELDLIAVSSVDSPELARKRPGRERSRLFVASSGVLPTLQR